MSGEILLHAFDGERLYEFERADKLSGSHFGGPMRAEFSGQSFGPRPLHLVACLGSLHIPALSAPYLNQMPLIFGMCYDGCELTYRFEADRKVEILKIVPAKSLENWPYVNFPPLIPYMPLRLCDSPRFESYDSFAGRFPNMPYPKPADIIVAVPPPQTIGLSFWAGGDWNGVTIVFECDLKNRQIKCYAMTS